jgi:steroid delta-isomerase-like uncharacterized protein
MWGMDNPGTMRSAYERINAGDVDGFGALLSDDFVEHETDPDTPPTKEGTLAFFAMLRAGFPDMQMSVDDLVDGGSKTVARVTFTGTHQGEFLGVPASGKHVEVQLIDIMRFDSAGLVCEHWGVSDMLTLMQQIGAVPSA